MARVLPEVVNHMTPAGEVRAQSEDLQSRGLAMFDQLVNPAGRSTHRDSNSQRGRTQTGAAPALALSPTAKRDRRYSQMFR